MKLENQIFEFDSFAAKMQELKEKKHFDYLVTIIGEDFGEEGFSTSYDFMTNADTPYIATNGLIENPVNPYTGNPLRLCDSNEDQLIYISEEWNVNYNNGTQYVDPEGFWLTVRENIWDDENWTYAGGAER